MAAHMKSYELIWSNTNHILVIRDELWYKKDGGGKHNNGITLKFIGECQVC